MENNKDWCHVFIVSGFEIYGEFASRYKVEELVYKSDLDTNGNQKITK